MKKESQKNFTSNYMLDLKTYKEFSKGYKITNQIYIISNIIMLLCLMPAVLSQNYTLSFQGSIFWIIYFLVVYFGFIKSNYKKILTANNDVVPKHTITIDSSGIKGISINGNKSEYSFEQIVEIIETKNLIILKLKNNLGILINKSTLKGGTKEELYSYLFNKCHNIKKKKISKSKNGLIINNILLILFTIIFITSYILHIKNDMYLTKIKEVLIANDYKIIELKNGDIDIIQIGDASDNYTTNIYQFNTEDNAQDNLKYWYKESANHYNYNSDCQSNNKETKCLIDDQDIYTIITQNKNFVFYGNVPPEYKEELNELYKLLETVE